MKKSILMGVIIGTTTLSSTLYAQDVPACTDCMVNLTPQGIMGDHLHKPGEYMLSYTFMRMEMEGNRDGTTTLSPDEVITFPNPNPGPANLRVVPTEMTMDMHMLGGMMGITDKLTGMVMVNYLDNSMDHITYNMGGTQIGTFTTKSEGFGDTKIGGLYSLLKEGPHALNAKLNISLPTGSIDEEDDVLTPMGTTPTLRMPYAMQLGSGTYDLEPGLTYVHYTDTWSYGAAYNGRLHLGRNSEGYSRGDWHEVSSWLGYQFDETLGVSTSLKARHESQIDGSDDQIAAPVQTADPDNYGGEKIHLGLQAGWKFYQQNTVKAGVSVPLYQDLNGPQLEDDYSFSLRWQNSF